MTTTNDKKRRASQEPENSSKRVEIEDTSKTGIKKKTQDRCAEYDSAYADWKAADKKLLQHKAAFLKIGWSEQDWQALLDNKLDLVSTACWSSTPTAVSKEKPEEKEEDKDVAAPKEPESKKTFAETVRSETADGEANVGSPKTLPKTEATQEPLRQEPGPKPGMEKNEVIGEPSKAKKDIGAKKHFSCYDYFLDRNSACRKGQNGECQYRHDDFDLGFTRSRGYLKAVREGTLPDETKQHADMLLAKEKIRNDSLAIRPGRPGNGGRGKSGR